MKATINGKRYDTSRCESLCSHNHYNGGNYSGTTTLMRAKDGVYLIHVDTNGQDLWLSDSLDAWDPAEHPISFFQGVSDEQEVRLAELGLVEIVE